MQLLKFVTSLLLFASAAQSVSAQGIDERHRDFFCGSAISGKFDRDWVGYAESNAQIDISIALEHVTCELARGTSGEYTGNMLHVAIRRNSNVVSIIPGVANHLLRSNPSVENRRVFVSLITGLGVDYDLFYQIKDTIEHDPSRREFANRAGEIICLSIDRFNVTELSDIRSTECLTEPFYFPLSE